MSILFAMKRFKADLSDLNDTLPSMQYIRVLESKSVDYKNMLSNDCVPDINTMNNIYFHVLTITVSPAHGPYHPHTIPFTLHFPTTYPFHPPQITTKLFHPNVFDSHVCLLREQWVCSISVADICGMLLVLLVEPDEGNAYDAVAGELFMRDRAAFCKRVEEELNKQ